MHKVSDGVRCTHDRDGGLVLDIRQGQIFSLNLVGSTILELLKRGTCVSEIVDDISRDFKISRDLAEIDVREFIETLKKYRLVEEHQSRTA
jgi:hypothetical protein